MNRYVIQGMALDMMEGKQIGLMAITRNSGRKALRSLFDFLDTPGVVGRWANGDERVEHPSGGTVHLLTASLDGLCRHTPDTLVVLDWNFIDQDLQFDLMHMRRGMEIIRW